MKKNKKVRINKKTLIVISVFLILLLTLTIKLIFFPRIYVGKIVNGKIVYSDNIENVTLGSDKNIIITFKNKYELIDSCIVTTNEIYKHLINKEKKYQLTLNDYLKLKEISNKEIYNINKAVELKLVNKNTKYSNYLAITCGFKNEKTLIKNIEAIQKLNKKL